MNIEQMRYFLEIARCGSFLEAATHLHITQPTLSRQITGIEGELNVQLFYRTSHGVKMTPAGELLYHEWTKTLGVYDQAIKSAQLAFQAINYTMNIGVLDGLKVSSFLPDFLAYMQTRHPNVKIHLKRLSFGEITQQLHHGEIDIGFSLDVNFLEETECHIHNIREYTPAIAVPKRNPLTQKDTVTLGDLKQESIAIVNQEECRGGVDMIVELCKQHGNFLPDLYFESSMENVLLWVESGLKCAILNDEMTITESSSVRMYPLHLDEDKRHVQMAYKKKNDSIIVSMVEDYLKKL